jgi:hypothetical protein
MNKQVYKISNQHHDGKNFILTVKFTWHMGSRWYTGDLQLVATDNAVFVPQ